MIYFFSHKHSTVILLVHTGNTRLPVLKNQGIASTDFMSQAGGIEILADALKVVQEEGLSVALLQCLTNAAEYPKCRPALQAQGLADVLQELVQNPASTERVQKAAAQALRLAQFKHWPQ